MEHKERNTETGRGDKEGEKTQESGSDMKGWGNMDKHERQGRHGMNTRRGTWAHKRGTRHKNTHINTEHTERDTEDEDTGGT